MEYLTKIFNDVVSRIFRNSKSSVAGVLAFVGYLTSVYGFEVPSDILAAISSTLLSLIGLLKKDK